MNADISLPVQVLRRRCDPGLFSFETTAELKPLDRIVGQERAESALEFGASMRRDGYNLFVLGPSGTGKRSLVTEYLVRRAAQEPVPDDWCYVNNFEQPDRPLAIRMAAGKGREFKADIEQTIDDLRAAIPATLESEEHRHKIEEVKQGFKNQHEEALAQLSDRAREKGLEVVRTPSGVALAPVREGEVISPEQYDALSEQERKGIEEAVEVLQPALVEIVRQLPQLKKQARRKVKELNRTATQWVVEHLTEPLREKYAASPEILRFIGSIEHDVVSRVEDWRKSTDELPEQMPFVVPPREPDFGVYQVNLLVDHSQTHGAPVIFEDHPSFYNLMGRIEHRAEMGSLVTDFGLIKAGSLLNANQGYLIIQAHELLTQPAAWQSLKRALKARRVQIESMDASLSLVSTVTLQPEPIPLDVKVVVLGDRQLYYLLFEYDPDFSELFKVAADFDDDMPRTDENCRLYAQLLATQARCNDCRDMDREAVALLIEQASRRADDSEKLSMHMRYAVDLVRESDYWAGKDAAELIERRHVERAIDHQIHRVDRIREVVQEQIRRGTLLVDTTGVCVGQVNGLSVMQIGNFAFGRPSRITATARLGKGDVVDIEREVDLGGALHSKGVLILTSFLAAKFARDSRLSLTASLVFEQSYGIVDGDSASMAELCALLSVLSDVPIRQNLAMTGSVNQHGVAQPIGGVNEKVEGFFDACFARGLTGTQGVLIPEANVKHLMLRRDVVEHAAEGLFHVRAFRNVDEAIELLTGVPSGRRMPAGVYEPESIYARVQQRLAHMADVTRQWGPRAESRGGELA